MSWSKKNIAGNLVDILTPGSNTDRLTFFKYSWRDLEDIAQNASTNAKVQTVTLRINPKEIKFDQPKITNKVQTNSPNRWIVFDWGLDLKTITVHGNTGNLLPSTITKGYNAIANIADSITSLAHVNEVSKRGIMGTSSDAQQIVNELMFRSMGYYELLRLSPKFRAFEKLQKLYETFDADRDVLTMTISDLIYRVFFAAFSFAQEANTPWNWKYEFTVQVLADLTDPIQRGDQEYPTTTNITLL